jgi:hypothetical protein
VIAFVRHQLVTLGRGGGWLWPGVLFLLAVICLGALAVQPAHSAYRAIAPVLLAFSAWLGWLVASALPAPLLHMTMVSVGGRERALVGRWLAAVVASLLPFLVAVIAAEVGRQAGASQPGIWWGGVASHLLAVLFGVGLGILLGARLPQRAGRPVPMAEATPKAVLVIVLVCAAGALPYAGALGGLLFLLATVGTSLAALTSST